MVDKTEEELILRAEAARIALRDADRALEEYRLTLCYLKVGDIVRRLGYKGRDYGKLYKIVKISAYSNNTFWYYGVMQKKDGEWSEAQVSLYSWEKVDAS